VARLGRFPEMLAAGIPVGLGSDGWSTRHDVARQAYLAATLFNEFRNQVPVIDVQTALEMATVHGARSVGLANEIGSLAPGWRADIVVHRRDRVMPLIDDPVPYLVHYGQSSTVDTVFVDGECILDHGEFKRFDAREMVREIDHHARERAQQIGYRRGTWPIVR